MVVDPEEQLPAAATLLSPLATPGAHAQSPQTRYAIERLKAMCQLRDQYAGLYLLGKEVDEEVALASDTASVRIHLDDLEDELFEMKLEMNTADIQSKLAKLDLFGLQTVLNQFAHFHTGEPFVVNSSVYTALDKLIAKELEEERQQKLLQQQQQQAKEATKRKKKKKEPQPPTAAPPGKTDLPGTPLDVSIHRVLMGVGVSHLHHILFAGDAIFVAFNLSDLSDICLLLYYDNVERVASERDIYYSMSAYTYNEARTVVVSEAEDLKPIKTSRVELCGSTLVLTMDLIHLCGNVKQMNAIAE
jgi:hypothetical protein